MSRLSAAQIAAHAHAAGFRGTALRNAVAVALAESNGDPRAVGVNSDRWRSRDRGLWQINDRWHPEVSDAEAFNPAQAAREAYRISSGGMSWSPWSTWKNGSAQRRFPEALIGVNQMGATGGATATAAPALIPGLPNPGELLVEGLPNVPGVPDVLGDVAGAMAAPVIILMKSAAWIADAHNWQRVAMVTGGTVGVLLALGMIAKSGAAGSTAEAIASIPGDAVKSAAKVAKIAAAKKA